MLELLFLYLIRRERGFLNGLTKLLARFLDFRKTRFNPD